jgi:hypothetical protein
MPRATTEKFGRAHQPAPKKKESQASGSNTNPLFNTARFGQHILKNPTTAQKSVFFFALFQRQRFAQHFAVRIVDAVSCVNPESVCSRYMI